MLPSTATFPLHAHFVPPLFKFIRFWVGPFHCRMIFFRTSAHCRRKKVTGKRVCIYTWDGPERGMLCFSLHVWVIFSLVLSCIFLYVAEVTKYVTRVFPFLISLNLKFLFLSPWYPVCPFLFLFLSSSRFLIQISAVSGFDDILKAWW